MPRQKVPDIDFDFFVLSQIKDLFAQGRIFINKVFERGPYPTAGGSSIVNATNWDAASGDYTLQGSSPSFRMIVDLSDLANSLAVIPTGESGHADHPHYIDMIDLWRLIQYHPMFWDLSAIQADAEGHLRLTP